MDNLGLCTKDLCINCVEQKAHSPVVCGPYLILFLSSFAARLRQHDGDQHQEDLLQQHQADGHALRHASAAHRPSDRDAQGAAGPQEHQALQGGRIVSSMAAASGLYFSELPIHVSMHPKPDYLTEYSDIDG